MIVVAYKKHINLVIPLLKEGTCYKAWETEETKMPRIVLEGP